LIGKYFLPKDIEINVKVIDTGESTVGPVLRADAVKFQLMERLSDTKKGSNELPISFELSQNYPNPFNPTTKIEYAIAKLPLRGGDGRGGLVTLKVYDILGKEVATLVNEEQSAGYYEVKFNAYGLASGIYFYRLQINSQGRNERFIETKKMLLLR